MKKCMHFTTFCYSHVYKITSDSTAYVYISMYIFKFLIRMAVILTKEHKLKILVRKMKVKINTEY